ncbi:MAG: DnaD domain protein [Clostridia bacterium]|nr:DnaD domain protein [Clostridia bacterium]
MAFCKYSSSLVDSATITIDAKFLNDYLPIAPESCLKVYLYGLLKCQNSAGYDNTLESFEENLGISKEDVINCFLYWQDQNLVQVLETDPIEVRYLPTKDNLKNLKKIDNKKYASFVAEVQDIISGRQINPNEYYKYIDFLETYHIQPSDFNMIVKYCVSKKGDNINCNYILTVAKVWAEEGVRTAEKIEEKIESLTLLTSDVNQVAKALKFKGNLSIEHQQLYEKWTKAYGFVLNNILLLAKKVSTKTKSYSFEMLDKTLTKYYELRLLSFAEMQEYEANKADLMTLAKEVNKCLGIYYESVENEVETYVIPWLNKGFNEQTLLQIANFCFKSNIRTLEGMDQSVQKFHKLGLVSVSSIDSHLNEVMATDNKIKTYLQKLNIDRRVNSFDRSFYRTWTYTYKFNDEIIDYALELSTNKTNGMQYANAILTEWYDKGVKTLTEAKKQSTTQEVKNTPSTFERKSFVARSYSEEEVNALFDNLDEINL